MLLFRKKFVTELWTQERRMLEKIAKWWDQIDGYLFITMFVTGIVGIAALYFGELFYGFNSLVDRTAFEQMLIVIGVLSLLTTFVCGFYFLISILLKIVIVLLALIAADTVYMLSLVPRGKRCFV